MESKRQQRIQKLLQQDLGIIFQQELTMVIHNAMVTVTKVNITPDLGLAKVYLSIFASNGKEEVLKGIQKHTSEIRFKLGNRIRHQLRQVPELHFYEDDSLDYIERIDNLLNEDPSI
ncbi:MAG: 30S ribosome-binding factor RbfA [Bacteroidales bacterium]|nr:30S ribosome-binding factor RbfA [Bacteroidales bacterium]